MIKLAMQNNAVVRTLTTNTHTGYYKSTHLQFANSSRTVCVVGYETPIPARTMAEGTTAASAWRTRRRYLAELCLGRCDSTFIHYTL